jgi:hypothetical protein
MAMLSNTLDTQCRHKCELLCIQLKVLMLPGSTMQSRGVGSSVISEDALKPTVR